MPPSSAGPFIEWLGSAESGPERLGGKAASLDRLSRMGFRIPPGFCLTTSAFLAQVEAVDGDRRRGSSPAELGAQNDVADRIAAAPVVAALAGELAAAVRRLSESAPSASGTPDGARFAVRSSALGEDGSAASYAGLHETELDVAPAGVDAAVRRCWASLWSPEALAYRAHRGISMAGAAMAVVVQSLVPADAAAVAFTRHPVTGREDQLVVTAVKGLGDAMVSGTVTPDTYVIEKATLRTVELTPGDGPRALDDASLAELAALCLRVEAGFGAAVDIEAAIAEGTWFLLQARPITTR
jgi:phosphoenolpyruvate synthase/pyruvate phosphate dikinase